MPKRKRPAEQSLEDKLPQYRNDLFRAFVKVRPLEKQRLKKHLRDRKTPPEKMQRLQREMALLNTLDFKLTADKHLRATFGRIKRLSNHPKFPEELRTPLPMLDASEEEMKLIQQVSSGLCNAPAVKKLMGRIIEDACELLEVGLPENKRSKKKRGNKDQKKEKAEETDGKDEGGESEIDDDEMEGKEEAQAKRVDEEPRGEKKGDGEAVKNTSKRASRENPTKQTAPQHTEDESEDEDMEKGFAEFNDMLGGSSDEEGLGSDSDEDGGAKITKGRSVHVRDMSESRSPSFTPSLSPEPRPQKETKRLKRRQSTGTQDDAVSPSRENPRSVEQEFRVARIMEDVSEQDAETSGSASDREASPSLSESPETEERPKKKMAKAVRGTVRDSTFLPTLMGGYISGSESEASDIDVAPRKNRLGQRQRRLLAEKKYGAKAKHLLKEAQQAKQGQGRGRGRDDGWDLKRGAVGPGDDRRKPWKKGGVSSQGGPRRTALDEHQPPDRKPPAQAKNDGPLHPSWEAKKKAKERQQQQRIAIQPSAVNKIVFDD